MSREIKFRVWDSYVNKMCNHGDYQPNSMIYYHLLGMNKANQEHCDKYYHTMQYSGMLDKNEKEIYEGDICRTISIDFGEELQRVVFKDGSFCFDYHGWPISDWKKHNIEIIGNIYENPEILKNEQIETSK